MHLTPTGLLMEGDFTHNAQIARLRPEWFPMDELNVSVAVLSLQ